MLIRANFTHVGARQCRAPTVPQKRLLVNTFSQNSQYISCMNLHCLIWLKVNTLGSRHESGNPECSAASCICGSITKSELINKTTFYEFAFFLKRLTSNSTSGKLNKLANTAKTPNPTIPAIPNCNNCPSAPLPLQKT
jgi:hypothetical protein